MSAGIPPNIRQEYLNRIESPSVHRRVPCQEELPDPTDFITTLDDPKMQAVVDEIASEMNRLTGFTSGTMTPMKILRAALDVLKGLKSESSVSASDDTKLARGKRVRAVYGPLVTVAV